MSNLIKTKAALKKNHTNSQTWRWYGAGLLLQDMPDLQLMETWILLSKRKFWEKENVQPSVFAAKLKHTSAAVVQWNQKHTCK